MTLYRTFPKRIPEKNYEKELRKRIRGNREVFSCAFFGNVPSVFPGKGDSSTTSCIGRFRRACRFRIPGRHDVQNASNGLDTTRIRHAYADITHLIPAQELVSSRLSRLFCPDIFVYNFNGKTRLDWFYACL